ncbi:hypothetical protein [Rhodobacter calidifons]|uniref:Concanavalin A-like lectin/glucanase superfamily protein n=1 Tax=Rhodobacter calidifons TaxID=2715277 RepID=A0ABX0G5N9_9RHOB|nr:hypothetical protein [Rhodobacter calidifons]NHB76568.1 hypothetical protein [Rhodobacter calidifons]
MLQIAAKLPPGALIGGDAERLAEAVLRSGGARFIARAVDLVQDGPAITGWREEQGATVALPAGPNTGNSRFDPGPPGAMLCREGENCGFTLPGFAAEVEAFTVAVVYRSQGEARTLASVFTGQTRNMIFLSERDGMVQVADRQATVGISLPLRPVPGARLAVMGYDGRRLHLGLDGQWAEAAAAIPGLAHPADFFIGCRSNRAGLAKTLGESRLHEVLFWPDRCLPGSEDPEDRAALAALHAHVRWSF